MKKLISAVIAGAIAMSASAQFTTAPKKTENSAIEGTTYVVGQQLEINGVPACVFYVDSSGHGLAFTTPAKTQDELEKAIKDGDKAGNGAKDVFKKINGVMAKNNLDNGRCFDREKAKKAGWLSKKKKTEVMTDLISKLGDKGAANHEAIIAYAREKGYDMAEVFPAQAYCEIVGEGWFVPSKDELIKLSMFLFGHYGENDRFSMTDYSAHQTKIANNPALMENAESAIAASSATDMMSIPAQYFTNQNLLNALMPVTMGQINKKKSILSSLAITPELGFMAMTFDFDLKKSKAPMATQLNGGWQGQENVLDSFIVPVYAF